MAEKKIAGLLLRQYSLWDDLKENMRIFLSRKEKTSHSYIKAKLDNLETLWTKFQANHEQLLALHTKDNITTEDYFKTKVYMQVEDVFCEYSAFYLEKLPSVEKTTSNPEVSKPKVKLPIVNVPSYDGNLHEWCSFSSLFKTLIDERPDISDVEKLQYLKASLKDEAHNIVKHFAVTGPNYKAAWSLLVDRYENPRIMVDVLLSKLTSLPTLKTESITALKTMVNSINECLHSLPNLQVPVDNWDPLLIHLLVPKLPNSIIREWERETGTSKTSPLISTFLNFLTNTFQIMESSKRLVSGCTTNPITIPTVPKIRNFLAKSNEISLCQLCSATHSIRNCTVFRQMTVQGRFEFLKLKRVCRNCLSFAHPTAQCPSTMNCRHCQGRHHTLLHLPLPKEGPIDNAKQEINTQEPRVPMPHEHAQTVHRTPSDRQQKERLLHEPPPTVAEASTAFPAEVFSHAGTMNNSPILETCLLATALIYVSYQGTRIPVRALIDPGSQATFITTRIVQLLRTPAHTVSTQISGLGGVSIGSSLSRVTLRFESRTNPEFKMTTPMVVLPKLTHLLPVQRVSTPNLDAYPHLTLADPHFDTPGQIDMLIGIEAYAQILLPGLLSLSSGLRMQSTTLGWIIFGSITTLDSNPSNLSVSSHHAYLEDDYVLRRFWELETIPNELETSESEEACENHYVSTTKRLSDGRYEVKLPFRDKSKSLGRSGHIAKAAFLQMEQKLLRTPLRYQQYQNCFQEYLDLGHMKPATLPEQYFRQSDGQTNSYRCFYLPHHSVIKESTTTQLRVVFNASQKSENGNSLNDILHTGTRLQSDIMIILIQWRLYPIAITADIAKMYRQIRVHPLDHAYQRIVWRADPAMPLTEYELLTVTFGVTTAPYLAIRTLKQIADDEGKRFPKAATQLKSNFYVDDFAGGEFEINAAKRLTTELKSLLKAGGFHLRKWASNCKEVIEEVEMEDRAIYSEESTVSVIKTLGVCWNPVTDILCFNVPKFSVKKPLTKRLVLSWIAALYDPLGFLAPLTVQWKIFMQTLWLEGLAWDEAMGESLELKWRILMQNCRTIQPLTVPRWSKFSPGYDMELHGFCDASKKAYAAVIYLRVVDPNSDITSRLLVCKTRVAPTKTVTIPRLELCGAVLLIKTLNYLRKQITALDVPFVLWTDSQVVLAWLRREPTCWTTFVANRVAYIQTHSERADWAYIRSNENPADLATRGCSVNEVMQNTLWWSGPKWLTNPRSYQKSPCTVDDTCLEAKRENVMVHKVTVLMSWLDKFSSLSRLIRVTAYILRFIRRKKATLPHGSLSSQELVDATLVCIHAVQQSAFASELHALKNGRYLHNKSPLVSLNPFLDKEGVMRVGGRLANSNLPYSEKHPVILPSCHHYTTLVVRHAHAQTLHGGTEMTSAYIRATYWILHTRSSIRKVLHQCVACFKVKQHSSTQLMANLPRERVIITKPFTNTGVDYAGPITLKPVGVRSNRTMKGYIAVFVCFSTKAFHLELVSDMTQEAFLAAFRRFSARRGLPKTIYSDCGTNFVGAKNILMRLAQNTIDCCANQKVDWKFIPPASPHFGGLWEAGVKLVKTHLKKTLGTAILNFEEYATVLVQIEACLNSRPLCPLSDDPHDFSTLTPGHFLINSALVSPPQEDLVNPPPNYLHRWQRLQQLLQQFWKQWSCCYLSRQQPRQKWKRTTPNLQPNDLVLIRDERLAPLHWRLGRIMSTNAGVDSLVRVATVRTTDGIIKRPIVKLFKLPIEYSDEETKTLSQPN